MTEARDALRAANFERAANIFGAVVDGSDPASAREAALYLARIELKRDPARALETIGRIRHARSAPIRAEMHLLAGVAYARLGRPRDAAKEFDAVGSVGSADRRISQELMFQRAAAAWIERKLHKSESYLAKISDPIEEDLDTNIRVLRGAIASAREDLPTQGAILLEAARLLRTHAAPNVHHHAVVASQIASLAVELPSRALLDVADEELLAVPWTPDIADLHFEALRSLAWRHALEGDEFNAFRRLKKAVTVAPSTAWRVVVLADRAYLAAVLGESRWAAQELRDAHELATHIDWSLVEGEEKLALPQLAELFASSDPTVATGYLTTFGKEGKRYPRVMSSANDRRVEAAEAYALGCVESALGQTVRAKRSLNRAWSIYERLGIAWRAARAATAIAEIDRSEVWFRRAENGIRLYPRSWLARGAKMTTPMSPDTDGPVKDLTAAQRAVFDLLLQGRDTQAIADQLGRSTFTVRNHIKAIFKTCAVSSRPALIVKFARMGR